MFTLSLTICSWDLGAYYPNTGNIEICSSLPVAEQKEVIAHELGHKFWFERMTQEERDEWKKQREEEMGELLQYLFWHTTPSVEEDFAYTIQELYEKKCTYPEMCQLTWKIIKNHK